MSAKVRVLVADDSKTIRAALCAFLDSEPRTEVVGQAADGLEAITLAKELHPDVITMDVQMPHIDGLGAIREIMIDAPCRILVVCSVTATSAVDLSFKAMEAGAMELIAKPSVTNADQLRGWGSKVIESVLLMSEVPVVTQLRRSTGRTVPPPSLRSTRGSVVDIFGIAASTGGPPALARILSSLPADFPTPVLIAQHMAPGFAQGLARWLADECSLPVDLVQDGETCARGIVYLPPDSHDLAIESGDILRVTKTLGGHCPSGDRLLSSLAHTYGARAAGVVLTGMGDDGAAGLLAIRNAGGETLAQDEATSAVFGMPEAARRLGAARDVAPLGAIGPWMCELGRRNVRV